MWRRGLAASEPVLRAGLERALAGGQHAVALDLLSALLPHWDANGRFGAHIQVVAAGVAVAEGAGPTSEAATEVLAWAGALRSNYLPGDDAALAHRLIRTAMERARRAGETMTSREVV